MLYFVGWLLYSLVNAAQTPDVQAKFFIYLTNWGFVCFNVYLFMAAISVTVTLYSHLHVGPPLDTLSLSEEASHAHYSLLSMAFTGPLLSLD